MRVLFIGNSHTYFNDMPQIFAEMVRQEGIPCEVTMIAHGGWYLAQHQAEPETRFNILYGNYDYVVLQEYAHPFGPEEKMYEAARQLNQWIREAGSIPVAYMTWAEKVNEAGQERMSAAYEHMAEEIGAVLAPVGREWWKVFHDGTDTELYYVDGEHASPAGSRLAASVIWKAIREAEKQ